MPAPPTTSAAKRWPRIPDDDVASDADVSCTGGGDAGCVAGAAAGASTVSSRGGKMTAVARPGSAFTRVDHGLRPAACASITYSPGSTGSETPHKLFGTGVPLRATSTP